MPLNKVIKRVKTAAREGRDVITAIGTNLSAQQDYRGGNPADRPVTKANTNRASKNLDRQIAEAARAILSGKKGTSSDTLNEYAKYKKGKMR
jgi:hypothetical protein